MFVIFSMAQCIAMLSKTPVIYILKSSVRHFRSQATLVFKQASVNPSQEVLTECMLTVFKYHHAAVGCDSCSRHLSASGTHAAF